MKKNYKYDFILPFFTASDDMCPVMKNIHKGEDGYIYATSSSMVIRIPIDKVGNEYKPVVNFPNTKCFLSETLNLPDNTTYHIAVDDLMMILSKAKWHKEMQSNKCTDCGGDGSIVCEYCWHSHDCDKCNGHGYIKKVAEFALLKEDDIFIVKIGEKFFRASHLHAITIAAKFAGVDCVEFISNASEKSLALFRFDDVEILLMPYLSNTPDTILRIKLI